MPIALHNPQLKELVYILWNQAGNTYN